MSKYIILTADIYPVGGMQLYVAGKTKFLKSLGYEVYVFYYSKSGDNISFPALREYENGNYKCLSVYPNQLLSNTISDNLDKMVAHIGLDDGEAYFIESHFDKVSIWGELLAEKLKGKHVCLNCNEVFRGKNKHYTDYIDFFYYKFKRNELAGISLKSVPMLFEGFYSIEESNQYVFVAKGDDPVQDVKNEQVKQLIKKDENICYIGRTEKECFENITKGVVEYAKRYSSIQIQYIIVGKIIDSNKNIIEKYFYDINNVSIVYLGDLVPIPRELFSKLDVVMAASGCANLSAREGVFTIVADADGEQSNGVLGYDTDNALFAEKHYSYVDALENVLRKKVYIDRKPELKTFKSKEYYYQDHLNRFFKNNDEKYFKTDNLVLKKRLLSKGTLFYYLGLA